ncbi:hypothetical protein SLA2020_389820 [Shorea laevis]|jgi:hypothetical protein
MIRPVLISFLRNENIELIEGKTGHHVSLCHYIMAAFERALTGRSGAKTTYLAARSAYPIADSFYYADKL